MDLKKLLSDIQPLVRSKAQGELIDRKISTLNNQIKELKKSKTELEKNTDDEAVMSELEAWADSLPKDTRASGDINRLLTALEYLNK